MAVSNVIQRKVERRQKKERKNRNPCPPTTHPLPIAKATFSETRTPRLTLRDTRTPRHPHSETLVLRDTCTPRHSHSETPRDTRTPRQGLLQFVVGASAIRGGFPNTEPSELFLAGAVAEFGWGKGRGCPSDCMDKNICKLKDSTYDRHSIEIHLCGRLDRHSFRAADVASTHPKYELGRWLLNSCFSQV